MKLLDIIVAPDPKLYKCAQNVTEFDEKLETFVNNMIYTMQENEGCGLASIQVEDDPSFKMKPYENYRAQPNVILVKSDNRLMVIINAQVLEYSTKSSYEPERCLSIPGKKSFSLIKRPESLKIRYNSISGSCIEETLVKEEARIFQHEYDHNIGRLFPNLLEKSREAFFWTKYLERKKK